MPHEMNERIEQIRERLEAATPGPWMPSPTAPDGKYRVYPQYPNYGNPKPLFQPSNHICTMNRQVKRASDQLQADTRFIAHAPSDIAYLLEQLQAAGKWVSVKERLPEVGWNPRLSHPVYVVGLGRPPGIRHYEPGGESWYDAAHGVDEPRHWYSHWMPLPAAPTPPVATEAGEKGGEDAGE